MDQRLRILLAAVVLVGCAPRSTDSTAAPGSLDTGFGESGFAALPEWIQPSAITIDGAGRVIVAGLDESSAQPAAFDIVRYDARGRLDAAFGTAGVFRWQPPPPANGPEDLAVTNLAALADGSILVTWTGPSFSLLNVMRLTEGGALDTTFGTMGIVTRSAEVAFPLMSPFALAADGSIFLAGRTSVDTLGTWKLAPSGVPAAWGPSGEVDITLATAAMPGMIPLMDGSLRLILDTVTPTGSSVVLANLHSDGSSLAYAFATAPSSGYVGAHAVVRSSSGALLGGTFALNQNVIRLDESGALDAFSATYSDPDYFNPTSLTTDNAGRVIAGNFQKVVRFAPDGSLDESFASNGVAILTVEQSLVAMSADSRDGILCAVRTGNGGAGGVFRLEP